MVSGRGVMAASHLQQAGRRRKSAGAFLSVERAACGSLPLSPQQKIGKALTLPIFVERETFIAPFGRKALRARTTSGEEFCVRSEFCGACGSLPLSPQQKIGKALTLPIFVERETFIAPFGRKALRARTTSGEEFCVRSEFCGACGSLPLSPQQKIGKALTLPIFVERETFIAPFGRKALRARTTSGEEFCVRSEFCGACGSLPLSPQQKIGKALTLPIFVERETGIEPAGISLGS